MGTGDRWARGGTVGHRHRDKSRSGYGYSDLSAVKAQYESTETHVPVREFRWNLQPTPLVALVAEFIPAARQAGGERESRWRTATIFFGVIGVFREPSTPTPHYHHP